HKRRDRQVALSSDITISTRLTHRKYSFGLRFHPLRSDDDATNGNANWRARSAHLWNGGAHGSRSGSGSRPLRTNQDGMSRRGLHTGCCPARHWVAGPLYHSHHAVEGSAVDRAQALAESQSATGDGLQGEPSEFRAAACAAIGSACATIAGEPAIVGICQSE